jgi:hypothetical protein
MWPKAAAECHAAAINSLQPVQQVVTFYDWSQHCTNNPRYLLIVSCHCQINEQVKACPFTGRLQPIPCCVRESMFHMLKANGVSATGHACSRYASPQEMNQELVDAVQNGHG